MVRDENCERLKISKTLYDMGMKVAAVSVLCQDRRVYDAMEMAGTPCPYLGKIGDQASDEWKANPGRIPPVAEMEMKRMFKNVMQLSLVAFLLLLFSCYSSSVSAQVSTTPSQSTPDLLDPSAQNWSGTYNTGWWGGVTGGPDPNRLPSDTGFIWSYGNNIISSTIAINQALSQAGIQVNGYSYQWKVKNGNANIFGNQPGIDDFVITVDVYDAQGNVYATYQYDYSYSHNWTIHSGSETFNNPFLPPSYFSNIIVSAQGEDVGYWAGHWGPEFNVADSSLTLTFSADPCYNNPLYDPQCPGYANALFLQQCTANPLYDPACPGMRQHILINSVPLIHYMTQLALAIKLHITISSALMIPYLILGVPIITLHSVKRILYMIWVV